MQYFHVPVSIPETFVKDLAILAGILCLCIIILSMIVYDSGFGGVYVFITSTMFGSLALSFGILAIGMVIVIYLLWRAFWRQV
jgi:membrane protein implicated in regulation of membrane protease activity